MDAGVAKELVRNDPGHINSCLRRSPASGEPGRGCCLLRAGGPVWAHSVAGDAQRWVTLGPEVTEGRGLVTLGSEVKGAPFYSSSARTTQEPVDLPGVPVGLWALLAEGLSPQGEAPAATRQATIIPGG